ncbi:MAG: AAA family ATPase [Oceanobacter sp.]
MADAVQSNDSNVRIRIRETPLRVLVTNSKGGCGKTTIATNLACAFAQRGDGTALIDFDPQSSAVEWLKVRPEEMPKIFGVDAINDSQTFTFKSWEMRLPSETRSVVIDSPAGVTGNDLSERIRKADVILIPVLPSAIDIRAATRFIAEVMLNPIFRTKPIPVAVIANRTKKTTLTYHKLEKFLKSLKIPFVASIRDVQQYVKSAEQGQGVLDETNIHYADKKTWKQITQWLDQQRKPFKR